MDTRDILNKRRHARGAVRPVVIAIFAIIALLAVGAWFLIIQPHEELMMADSGGHPSTPVTAETRAAPPPPANVEGMDVNQLITEARAAMGEQRYLAPAGNNAFEFYLKALEREPGNPVATDALRETFPFAASAAEQQINAGNFNEAQREIDLLAKADPANYTLTILRSKLDAQRKVADKAQQDAADQARQQQLAAQKAAEEKAAADKAAQEQATQVAATTTRPAGPATTQKPASTPNQTAQVAPVQSSSTPAVLIRSVQPRYPTQAQRARTEGFVVLSFTVKPDGHTADIKVVEAQPRHVFERAAIDAVDRWEFKPATRNGEPVDSTVTNRINFKL